MTRTLIEHIVKFLTYTITAKPIKTLELPYAMVQFEIIMASLDN